MGGRSPKLRDATLSPSGVYKFVKRYFPKSSPHGARSRCITDTALEGDLEAVRIVARHESSSTTHGYVQADLAREAMKRAPAFGEWDSNARA